jgi:hypothetical protein
MHLRYAANLGRVADAETLLAAGSSDAGHYRLSMSTSDAAQRFMAVATVDPDGRQSQDAACHRLAVDETGRRRTATRSGAWRDDDPQHCWG